MLLLYQEEGWETPTRTRLPTRQPMDYTQRLPPPLDTRTHRQIKWMFPSHQVRHTLGIQQC
jgi:hypothetical protein